MTTLYRVRKEEIIDFLDPRFRTSEAGFVVF